MKKYIFLEYIQNNFMSLFTGFFTILLVTGSLNWVDASILGSSGNTLTGTNNRFINLSNSGVYGVSYSLNGTMNTGDTLRISAVDGSGNTATTSFVSPSGGESSGSLLLNLSNNFTEGTIFLSGEIYTGGIMSQVVATGMTTNVTLDTHRPVVSLVGSGTLTIALGSTYAELGASWTDTIDGTGNLAIANTGSVNTTKTGSYILEYWKVDASGNASLIITRTVNVIVGLDTISPLVSVTSHNNNDIVTGVPLLSGLVSDTGGIANVKVNGVLATLGLSGNWSLSMTNLTEGSNTLTIIATDHAGNTGSTSITLNRVSIASNINTSLSGSTSAIITFSTDFSATGIVRYGTGISLLNSTVTGSSMGTSHTFLLMGLIPDTNYYFTVQGQGGQVSTIQQYKTPLSVNNTASGSIVINGPVYLSGSTRTGVTLIGSGSIRLQSISSGNSFLSFPFNPLRIIATSGNWDGVIEPPERTSQVVSMLVPGYSFTGNAYQIGNSHTELEFSGQLATISVRIGAALSGKTIKIFRSTNQGITYGDFSTCIVTGIGDCIFTTDHLSLFGFAMPSDTTPDTFSFSSITNVELNTYYTSNTIVISGITGQTAISITGGEYSINGSPFTPLSGVVQLGDSIIIKSLSSSAYSSIKNATLTIGGISGIFSVTTKESYISGGGIIIGPGGGGGGGGGRSIDTCLGGDFSPSYYDGLCMATAGNIITGIVTESFHIPAIFINNTSDILFRDIGNNWARSYIIRLVIRGIIDNAILFRPDAGLTRAEFLKIIINTTGWTLPVSSGYLPFRDVSSSSWYAPYVSLALSGGLIKSATDFNPNNSITRAEATKIFMKALGVTVNEPSTMTFVDVNKNSDLAKYIEAAKFLNILSGQVRNNRRIFRPNDPITRSEIAKVVVNAFGL